MTKEVFIKELTLASVGGLLAGYLGGLDFLLKILILFIILDYISGILKAFYEKKISSNIGIRGIAKKVYLLIIVAVSFAIEEITSGVFPLREVVIFFFITNEGISILENGAALGVPLPKKLTDTLAQLKSESMNGKKKEEDENSKTDFTHK